MKTLGYFVTEMIDQVWLSSKSLVFNSLLYIYLRYYWTKWECNSQFVRKGSAFY